VRPVSWCAGPPRTTTRTRACPSPVWARPAGRSPVPSAALPLDLGVAESPRAGAGGDPSPRIESSDCGTISAAATAATAAGTCGSSSCCTAQTAVPPPSTPSSAAAAIDQPPLTLAGAGGVTCSAPSALTAVADADGPGAEHVASRSVMPVAGNTPGTSGATFEATSSTSVTPATADESAASPVRTAPARLPDRPPPAPSREPRGSSPAHPHRARRGSPPPSPRRPETSPPRR
jgi:hypothetical protein